MLIAEGLHPTQSTNGLKANGKAQRDDGVDREFTHGLVEGLHLCLQIRLGGGVGCSSEASLVEDILRSHFLTVSGVSDLMLRAQRERQCVVFQLSI